jgi:hypothetical protein
MDLLRSEKKNSEEIAGVDEDEEEEECKVVLRQAALILSLFRHLRR